jgi:hypothetical protein
MPRLNHRAITPHRPALLLWLALFAGSAAACGRRPGSGANEHAVAAAVASPPPEVTPRLPLALRADSLFWRTLHAGAYDSIPRAMIALKAAYLQMPTDAVTAGHIAFLHTWRLAERSRLPMLSPAITDEAILARYYFDRARALAPTYDARIHGFASVMRMVEGGIHRDSMLVAAGLAEGRRSIARWPEFNLFSIGYALSARPDTSAAFREGLEMQWRTLDLCRRGRVDRSDPAFQGSLGEGLEEPDLAKRRACYNSWIAPHNVEGFFLNMGDMLMRSGDWRTARKVYALARQSTTYPAWPYREVLESRIVEAEGSLAEFQGEGRRLMFGSRFACSACHQER